MTKDELAKKRGMKPKQTPQTPAEALITTIPEPKEKETVGENTKEEADREPKEEKATSKTEKQKKPEKTKEINKPKEKTDTPKDPSEEKDREGSSDTSGSSESDHTVTNPAAAPEETPTSAQQQDNKLRLGRPKGRPSTKCSFNVPNEYLDMVSIAAAIGHKGNMSSYIVSLIEKDIKENGNIYQQVLNLRK
jgi:outer membrane biosynthesis protein TonB